jgi:hypothetical protein
MIVYHNPQFNWIQMNLSTQATKSESFQFFFHFLLSNFLIIFTFLDLILILISLSLIHCCRMIQCVGVQRIRKIDLCKFFIQTIFLSNLEIKTFLQDGKFKLTKITQSSKRNSCV